MKKIFVTTVLAVGVFQIAHAQIFFTKSGNINFNSSSAVEKIAAKNNNVACKLNIATGDLDFVVLNKSFVFDIQLMQEHFNENYMESEKFPKSSFKGKVSSANPIAYTTDGNYKVTVAGTMNMHGVSKAVNVPGTITVKGGKITLNSSFAIMLADYGIKVPGEVKDKISKDSKITVNCILEALKK
jgi:polyisoprenoid-binding protein YceI